MKMKNKKSAQEEERRLHRDKVREDKKKKRQVGSSLERQDLSLNIKPRILIVCEGELTEPSYFEQFRLSSATVEIMGKGRNTISLVEEALRLSKESSEKFSEIWCVFDKDDFPDTDFNNAIIVAQSYGFKIAYSNQAFEYWLLLHINDHQGGSINRSVYAEMINSNLKQFGLIYGANGKKVVTEEMFLFFLARDSKFQDRRRIDLAIQRAKKLNENYNKDETQPSSRCSNSTVYELVEELLKYTE